MLCKLQKYGFQVIESLPWHFFFLVQIGKKSVFPQQGEKPLHLVTAEANSMAELCGEILYLTESVKYLGVKINTNLCWHYSVNELSIKLNRANALLFKMRRHVSKYLDPSLLLYLTPTDPAALLPGLRIVGSFNKL